MGWEDHREDEWQVFQGYLEGGGAHGGGCWHGIHGPGDLDEDENASPRTSVSRSQLCFVSLHCHLRSWFSSVLAFLCQSSLPHAPGLDWHFLRWFLLDHFGCFGYFGCSGCCSSTLATCSLAPRWLLEGGEVASASNNFHCHSPLPSWFGLVWREQSDSLAFGCWAWICLFLYFAVGGLVWWLEKRSAVAGLVHCHMKLSCVGCLGCWHKILKTYHSFPMRLGLAYLIREDLFPFSADSLEQVSVEFCFLLVDGLFFLWWFGLAQFLENDLMVVYISENLVVWFGGGCDLLLSVFGSVDLICGNHVGGN